MSLARAVITTVEALAYQVALTPPNPTLQKNRYHTDAPHILQIAPSIFWVCGISPCQPRLISIPPKGSQGRPVVLRSLRGRSLSDNSHNAVSIRADACLSSRTSVLVPAFAVSIPISHLPHRSRGNGAGRHRARGMLPFSRGTLHLRFDGASGP